MSEINSPFKDAQVPAPSKDSSVNVSLQGGDPGYKKQTPAAIPEATSRHANLDYWNRHKT